MAGIVLYLDIKRTCAWQQHVLFCLSLCETLQHDINQSIISASKGKIRVFWGKTLENPRFFGQCFDDDVYGGNFTSSFFVGIGDGKSG